ncbi:MAG TPA: hypothetical protein PLL66_06745 [Bacteroidales bacterium]|nr:hypothetical protein [Bacteroidales bacterium]
MEKRIGVIIKIVLSLLFLGCLFDMPYFYYQFVRVIGMTGFAILAYLDWKNENKIFAIVWAVVIVFSMIFISSVYSKGQELK